MSLKLGIDYGTTTTQISFLKDGSIPSLVEIGEGAGYEKYSVRSVVAVDPRGKLPVLIGDEADSNRVALPSLKRCLACTYDKKTGTGICHNRPNFDLCEGQGKYRIGSKTYTVDELVKLFFEELFNRFIEKKPNGVRLLDLAEAQLRFSVPPSHTREIRERVRTAIGNTFCVAPDRLVNEEPTCALATVYQEKRLRDGLHVVCDIGGGTTDTAMIYVDGGTIYLLKTDSLLIGGNDLDECLWRHLRPLPELNSMADHVLRRECRVLKERLTTGEVASLSGVSVSRETFEALILEPVIQIVEFVKNYILAQAKNLPSEKRQHYVDVEIHLAGGGSRVPLVQERLANLGFSAIRTKVNKIRADSTALFGEDLIIFAIALGNLFDTEGYNLLSLPIDIEVFEDGNWVTKAGANTPFPVKVHVPYSGNLQVRGRRGERTFNLLEAEPHTPPIISPGAYLSRNARNLGEVLAQVGSCTFHFRDGGLFFVTAARRERWFQAPWSNEINEEAMKISLHDFRRESGYSAMPSN